MGNMLIANYLTLIDVAHYEISFKLFSMAEVIPVILSTSLFPTLLKKLKEDKEGAIRFYKNVFLGYALYGCMAFTFIYSFSDQIIPWLFGVKFIATPIYCKEMFLTMLVFPTAILQANLLVALRQEKVDMWLNIASLVFNVLISITGLYFVKSITVINLSILLSFLIFHLLQDHFLIKSKIISLKSALYFYVFITIGLVVYFILSQYLMPIFVFLIFWSLIMVVLYYYKVAGNKRNIPLASIQ
jgi:O-antigen/teichoic acid export membrane protein